jgi:type IV pilus assembly protein PilE
MPISIRRAVPPQRGFTLIERQRGFTLIEVMITVAIVAILAAIALPSYTAYIQRAKVPAGLDALQAYFSRMEQRYQDTNTYAEGGACAIAVPAVANYDFACAVTGEGVASTYIATVTGKGQLAGYAYTINQNGERKTTAHPKGANDSCWSIRGGASCDA